MDVVRIANCSGFLGDRHSAAREMVEGGPIDVLTGDYLAELTMALLWRARAADPGAGYAHTFLDQLEEVLAGCLERGVKVVSNAGGLAPLALAARIEEMGDRLGLSPVVASVTGDDLIDRLDEMREAGHELAHLDTDVPLAQSGGDPVTANAYLGARGIARALEGGADVVVTGRVTDAALVVGPAAWRFGWAGDDWDRLAGALVAGHVIECGAQVTGGNYSFFREVPGLDHVGFPLVEIEEDGAFTVTKHPDTGGLVSVGTVTAQLLYEIEGPVYRSPDVTARFDTIRLTADGPDRVRVDGVRGEPPPPDVKVSINRFGGFRNDITVVLTGLDIEEKAAVVESALWAAVGGREQFAETDIRLVRWDRPDPAGHEQAMAHLRVTVKDPHRERVGRAFSRRMVELALASCPGFFATAPPGDARPFAVHWPALAPARMFPQVVRVGDRVEIVEPLAPARTEGAPPTAEPLDDRAVSEVPAPAGPTAQVPLGTVFGARSGDKGGNANVGVWGPTAASYRWLADHLTIERFRRMVPEAAGLALQRHAFPNLRALNFVVEGLLGEGVAASTLLDPQAKSLGEYLRAKVVDMPVELLEDRSGDGA